MSVWLSVSVSLSLSLSLPGIGGMCACVHAYVCTIIWRPKVSLESHSSGTVCLTFLKQGLSWEPGVLG